MPLTRRATGRVTANIWPGFVDAVTSLLMVVTFVLTIFIVVQYVLREEISGQQSKLDALDREVRGLTDALGMARMRAEDLAAERDAQSTLIAELRGTLAQRRARVAELEAETAGFEAEVAALAAARDAAEGRAAASETARDAALADLAAARDEIDAQAEQARLDAARREALEALTARLRDEAAARSDRVASLEDALGAEEAARAAEAAAAEDLRTRLAESEAELTALSLNLEEERRRAEETLTLLAAAEAAEEDLTARLTAALLAGEAAAAEAGETAAALAETRGELDRTEALLEAALARADESAKERAAIARALESAEAARTAFRGDLDEARAALAAAEAEVARLRAAAGREAEERDRLAAALAAARQEAGALEAARTAEADLRDQLAQALALELEARNRAEERAGEIDRQAALLARARSDLAETEAAAAETARDMAALNRQVARLRRQVGTLQTLLDVAEEEERESEAEIESLGQQLNAALIREAEEQRRRAELEAAERQRLERYRSEFFGRMREVLGDREGVEIAGDRFVFDSEVLFPSGSAILSPEGREQVARVAALLNDVRAEIPESIDWVIRVDGHTDDVPLSGTGRYRDNWELSQARALSVVRYMSRELGFPEERLAPTGFGEFRPVDTSGTPEARARNRRIELKLTER